MKATKLASLAVVAGALALGFGFSGCASNSDGQTDRVESRSAAPMDTGGHMGMRDMGDYGPVGTPIIPK